MGSNFGGIPTLTSEIAALEHLKKNGENNVNTLEPLFLIGSSSFLQVHVTRTTIISWMSLNFGQI